MSRQGAGYFNSSKGCQDFQELNEKENVTILMTTHDRGFMDIGDRAYELEDGEIKNEY